MEAHGIGIQERKIYFGPPADKAALWLTKREYFAGLAMQAMINCERVAPVEVTARMAVQHADALLALFAELSKKSEPLSEDEKNHSGYAENPKGCS